MSSPIPVILFAYARADCLERVLSCLRENEVPLVYAFADGPKGDGTGADAAGVAAVRDRLRAVDWCDLHLVEREQNLGLGRNIVSGVSAVSRDHDAFIVWEDDLVCCPGTYAWVCAALRHYQHDKRVMSVSAWNHPRVTPAGITGEAYFDRRGECWVWGGYARSWRGMAEADAMTKLRRVEAAGRPAWDYGADLPRMAAEETVRNTWATRWLYHHFEHDGLCLRPVRSMVDHIGLDERATNAGDAEAWRTPELPAAVEPPAHWPDVAEHPGCRARWQAVAPRETWLGRWKARLRRRLPASWLARLRWWAGKPGFYGDYASWEQAAARTGGYDQAAILERVLTASRAVREGKAAWERDGVTFAEPESNGPLLKVLRQAADGLGRPLRVVDFGGALGSTWWQHRREFAAGVVADWVVVEQPHFVAVGRREFTLDSLRFADDFATVLAEDRPDLVLFSSVLAYLPDPYSVLRQAAASGVTWIVLDKTGIRSDGGDRLTIQRVPREIYRASYPCWFLDAARLVREMGDDWAQVADWSAYDFAEDGLVFRGLAFRRHAPQGSAQS